MLRYIGAPPHPTSLPLARLRLSFSLLWECWQLRALSGTCFQLQIATLFISHLLRGQPASNGYRDPAQLPCIKLEQSEGTSQFYNFLCNLVKPLSILWLDWNFCPFPIVFLLLPYRYQPLKKLLISVSVSVSKTTQLKTPSITLSLQKQPLLASVSE